MKKNWFIKTIFLLSVLWVSQVHGQSYNFVHYGIPEGLPQSQVFDICQDNFGNLWLATQGGGLTKFNGTTFENYSTKDGLSSNFFRSVVCDKDGKVWAATAKGVSLIHGDSISNIINKENNSVNLVFDDSKGNIWFSPKMKGISRVSNRGEIEHFNETNGFFSDKVIDIKEDAKTGTIWFVTVVNGLVKYRDGIFEKVLNSREINAFVLTIFLKKDVMFVGTTGGLLQFNLRSDSIEYSRIPEFDGFFIKSVLQDREDNLWVISSSKVIKYQNGKMNYMNASNGFTSKSVLKLFEDDEGNVWFGTDGDGIYQYKDDVFTRYGKEHGLPNQNVTSILKAEDESYYFSTLGGGLIHFEDGEFKEGFIKEPWVNRYMTSLSKDLNGDLWIGTRDGLVQYNGVHCTQYKNEDGLVHNSIRYLFHDSKDRLWIATIKGLSLFEKGAFKNFTSTNGLMDDVVWNIFEQDDGIIYIVTRKGISIYKENQMVDFLQNELFEKRVNTILKDNNNKFWIGYSGHGVARFDPQTGETITISEKDGLKSNFIYNLALDVNNNIIVATERGFDKVIFDSSNVKVDYIKNYGIGNDVFYNVEPNNGAIYYDEDGSIWFGSKNGVYIYNPKNEDRNFQEPTTYISGIKLFYNEVDWKSYSDSTTSWFNLPKNLKLNYDQNHLDFTFYGNCLSGPSEVKYQFKLENFSENWSPVSTDNTAAFTNLNPGKYTFKVRSANNDGIWNTKPVEFTFEVVPPFWQRPLFFILIGLTLVLAIKLFYNYRMKINLEKVLTLEKVRSEEAEAIRKRMARDFHDNMGNQLASITVFTNLISFKLKGQPPEILSLLGNIEKHTKSLFNGTKDFIWSMDPASDDLNEIYTYIKDFGEELFNNTDIHFYSNAEILDDKIHPVPGGWSRQVVLIFKEAMTNALKHSGASEIHFDINLHDEAFVLKLRDNGKGFDPETIKKGNGINNMAMRARQIDCKYENKLAVEGGVEIVLKGKLRTSKNK